MQILDLKVHPEHIPQLAEWHHVEWAALNPGQTLQQRIDKMQKYLGDELVPSTYIVLDADTLVGSAALIEYDMDKPGWTPWLASVYIRPEYRKQGIATRLIQHVMNTAGVAGVEKLFLFTPDQSDFYSKRGWSVVSQERYRNHDVTIMKVNLIEKLL